MLSKGTMQETGPSRLRLMASTADCGLPAPGAWQVLHSLPDELASRVVNELRGKEKRALRLTCKAAKRIVDASIASYELSANQSLSTFNLPQVGDVTNNVAPPAREPSPLPPLTPAAVRWGMLRTVLPQSG